MDFGKLIKWIVIVALVVFGWKTFGPRIKAKLDSSTRSESSATSGAGSVCVNGAAAASERWGSGLARFVNPPYDLDAWGRFRGDVEAQIAKAQAQCGCAEESCRTAKNALSDLRGLVSELDTAIRTGGETPSDIVRRQEAIDNAIDEARALSQTGK
jgi:hypothetical protein